jgi:menaquinone-dependent protoporphyrinogen oxidase
MRVLVAAAGKHGSTAEVADAIAAELREAGFEAIRQDAVPEMELDGFDAVVLGSAIYAGSWVEEAAKLLDGRGEELARAPLWLFSVGPIGDPPKPEEAEPEDITAAGEQLDARGHEVFAGKLDLSVLRHLERLMVRAFKAPEGDFRDWDAIRAWARGIAAELQAR